MAFCPNCGTPNTEQAERCVACGFELIVPKQKAKFKGTIMMSGIKAPSVPQGGRDPDPAPTSAPPSQPVPARNLNYQKTMLGQPPVAPPPKQGTPSPEQDLGSMPTMQGASPVQLPSQPSTPPAYVGTNTREFQPDLAFPNQSRPVTPAPSAPSAPRQSTPTPPQPTMQGGFTPKPASSSYGSTITGAKASPSAGHMPMGGAYESTIPPAAPPNPAKVIAVGCAVVLALVLVVGGTLWFAFGDRLKSMFGGGDSEANAAEAAAWHASIAQSLTKVNELCSSDCAAAGVFFHPLKQAALLGEAKALTPARVAKLNDPTSASAIMLDHTDDSAIATQLGLDPQQCARVTAGGAKVISCSVPDPTGKPSVLRIVQLSGIGTL